MKAKILATSVAMALALTATSASAVTFSGYFRSGVGVSTDGKMQTANKQVVGRLGNEDDTYGEIGLGQELYNQDGQVFYVDSMVSMESNGSSDGETTKNDDAVFGLRQFNLQAKGFIKASPDAVVWAGKRYYQRHDLHIIDTKYLNISGSGAGIENIKAGDGAFSLAWIRGDADNLEATLPDDENDLNVNYLDLRYAGIKPWNGAWGEIAVTYAMPNATDAQKAVGGNYDAENGVMLTTEMSQFFSSTNINEKLVLQYANKGLAQNMISQGGGWYDAWHDTDEGTGYRVILAGNIPFGEKWAIDHVITSGKAEKLEAWHDNTDLFSAVARGQYVWTKNMKTLLEVGSFEQNKEWTSGAVDKSSGQKYTIAQAFTAGIPFLSRPELRVFASYLKDGENQGAFNSGKDDNTMNFGVQAEAWW